ncbi:vesicular glutamate transporter 3-like [Planococcus citri]|uniref:vesicular glutamate transporter 3-like n=1 Tax=Planococcus citri TaxID=170843 RepID=UPI0031F96581
MRLPKCISIPKRYIIVGMVFVGYTIMFYLHSNLGMAVVEMTTKKNITLQNGTVEQKADFNWSSNEKGIILSSFSYGRLLSPIGGILAGKFGGSTIYSIGILITSLITFFSPVFLHISFNLFVITNVMLGAFEAFSYSSITQLFSRWAPPDERAKFVSFSVVGVNFGSGMSFIISGWILNSWNWEKLFYFSGAASFLWFWIWLFIVKNDPSEDKHISKAEAEYIKNSVANTDGHDKLVYPWTKIFSSMPLWVACLAKFTVGCNLTFAFMYLPQYIKDTNNVDIKKIGFISMIPQICAILSTPISGCISDYLRSHKILSVTNIHKLFVSIGIFTSTISFMLIVFLSSLTVRIITISVMQFFGVYAMMSILVVFLDLAPRYASFLNAIANVFFTSSGILTPILVGFIVTSHSVYQWNICFIVLSCVCFVIGLLYLMFGSGEEQSWANYNPAKTIKRPNEEES